MTTKTPRSPPDNQDQKLGDPRIRDHASPLPGYTGPKDYVRPAIQQAPPIVAAEPPTPERTKKRTKRLKR
ncbi:hypothetical protein Vi05172_g3880 [Venturia inaequalis]|nr:hypothetical protein Vi05172_g3880 [Venturia inaequalis]